MRSLRIDGETDGQFSERAERSALVAKALIKACLANECVQQYVADPEIPFTEEGLRANPIIRLDFDHAFAIGGIGETLAATKSKNWGDGPYVLPLGPDDWFYPDRITFHYKESSPYNRRFELRQKMKELLGKKHRPLVERARKNDRKEFLESLSRTERWVIYNIVRLDPILFWRAAKGKSSPYLPETPQQQGLDFG